MNLRRQEQQKCRPRLVCVRVELDVRVCFVLLFMVAVAWQGEREKRLPTLNRDSPHYTINIISYLYNNY